MRASQVVRDRLRRAWPLFVSLALTPACYRPSSTAQNPPLEVRSNTPDLAAETRSLMALVSEIRGLSPREAVRVEALEESAFEAALTEHQRALSSDHGKPEPRETHPSTYLGFYDFLKKCIYVRKHMPDWFKGDPRPVLAHELEHVLQDQHFGIEKLWSRATTADESLAIAALLEGDAELVGVGVEAKLRQRPWRRALLNAALGGQSAEELVGSGAMAPAMLAEDPTLRTRTIFKYESGLRFASSLFRAGGMALMSEAFRRPPMNTGHILHPERYLAGERPLLVAGVLAPSRQAARVDIPFGELSVQLFLQRLGCPGDAAEATVGWRGDRFQLFGQEGAETMVLSTVWDDDAHATRFQQRLSQCFERPITKRSPSVTSRAGTLVTLTTGTNPHTVHTLARLARKLPGTTPLPPAPELSVTKLPPPPSLLGSAPEQRGEINHSGTYINRWLGISSSVARMETGSSSGPDFQLQVASTRPYLSGVFFVGEGSGEQTADALESAVLRGIQKSLTGKAARPMLSRLAPSHVQTPLGPGTSRTWHARFEAGNGFFAQVVVVPGCGGRVMYMWTTYWVEPQGKRLVDDWIRSFRFTQAAPSAACLDYQRQASEDL